MFIVPFTLSELKLTNFKSYDFKVFDFKEKLNFIVGKNGKGKTNLLDAIYYSCFTKSYLSSTDLMVPNFEQSFFRVETHFLLNSENQLLEIKYIKQEKKEVLINKVKIDKQADFIGKFPCVIITPDDNQLILGASDIRRKFLDSTIAQFSTEYLNQLLVYNKILAQRNAILKYFFESKTFDKNLLEAYNTRLISSGTVIFSYRKTFAEQFLPIFNQIYTQIFEGNENIKISYDSCLLHISYEEIIANNEQQDRNAQRTTKGIHTDDLIFELNQFPIKKIGSQGQQKTFLLSLKLAQFELLKREKKMFPILLLDDIFDKLDNERISKLFKLVYSENFGQVFITDTDEHKIQSLIEENKISNYKIINLE